MTRQEALHILGLEDGASAEDVTLAYRELAQMLHPDKYGGNDHLRKRAEAQMRSINEARDVLLGSRKASRPSAAGSSRGASGSTGAQARARATAAETARLTIVQHMRTLSDIKRNARIMLAVGLVGMLVSIRLRGTLRTLAFPISTTLVVWGGVDYFRAARELGVLREREKELARERDAAKRKVDA